MFEIKRRNEIDERKLDERKEIILAYNDGYNAAKIGKNLDCNPYFSSANGRIYRTLDEWKWIEWRQGWFHYYNRHDPGIEYQVDISISNGIRQLDLIKIK